MTDDPIQASIDKIGKRGDGLTFGVTKDGDDVGARVEGEKSLGKGWTIGGGVQWVKDKGNALFFGGSWRPKGKP